MSRGPVRAGLRGAVRVRARRQVRHRHGALPLPAGVARGQLSGDNNDCY